MTNAEWSHRILEHKIAVSDTWAFSHSEAPNLFMFWSSADLYVDKNPQAKDLIRYTRIREL